VISSRRIVVLPDPEGPIRVTFSPRPTVKSRSSSTTSLPNRLTTLSKRIIASRSGPTVGSCAGPTVGSVVGKALLQSSDQHRRRVARDEEEHARQGQRLQVL